jgi:hypothetical protein
MWKQFLYAALTVFLATVVEVCLIYLTKRKGNLGFKVALKPDFEIF